MPAASQHFIDPSPHRPIVTGAMNIKSATSTHESVCAEADRLVSTERNDDYGHPAEDFARIAEYWSTFLGHTITAEQVPLMMVLMKISREQNRPKRDNLVDICGYAKTLEMVHDKRNAHAL